MRRDPHYPSRLRTVNRHPARARAVWIVLLMMAIPWLGVGRSDGLVPVLGAHAQGREGQRAAADRLLLRGIDAVRRGEYRKALAPWREALSRYEALGDQQRQGVALSNLATAHLRLGEPAAAVPYLSRALALPSLPERGEDRRSLLSKLGEAYQALGDTPRAISAYQDLLAQAGAARDHLREAMGLGNLGQLYRDQGRTDEAVGALRRAAEVAREAGDRQNQGAAQWRLGEIALESEDYVAAVAAYSQALQLARELGDDTRRASALRRLGTAHYYLGDYSKARELLERSLELARRDGERQTQASALAGLGAVDYFLEDWPAAIRHFGAQVALAREMGDRPAEGRALGNLALAHSKLGDTRTALDLLGRDLAIAREIGDRRMEGRARLNRATTHHESGDLEAAIRDYEGSLRVFRSIGYRRGEGLVLTDLGAALLARGQDAEAQGRLERAMEVLEDLREPAEAVDAFNRSLFETHLLTYRLLQRVLVRRGRPEAALEVAERGRARALARLLARAPRARREALEEAPPTRRQVRELAARSGATLVEYSLIPETAEVYVWVVDPKGAIHFRRVGLGGVLQGRYGSLAELVREARAGLGLGGRGVARVVETGGEPDEALRLLYTVLVAPIAEWLPADPERTVVVVPQGSLYLVPFAALPGPSGAPLVARHTLAAMPSIQTLDLIQRRAPARSGTRGFPLVVGNPAMPSYAPRPGATPRRLSALPGAEREARVVARLVGVRPLTGREATKAAVLARIGTARIVHLATHGLLDDRRGVGIPGSIALAPAGGDDGLLTAGEVADLRLRADLVVLSACDTGRGQVSGDGVVGLSRSFISAGAGAVLVSLWAVPDAPTAELMGELYRGLAAGRPRAVSLRRAMLAVRERHPRPSDWAAFLLYGGVD